VPRWLKVLLILLGVAIFLTISFGLARVLSADNAERAAIGDLIAAQARGDVPEMLELMEGCRENPVCVRQVGENTQNPELRTREQVQILRVDTPTSFSLGSETGVARVAWRPSDGDPRVQCVAVRRGGNVISGPTVDLLSISGPIDPEGSCGGDE
jgi:hypothetical protein